MAFCCLVISCNPTGPGDSQVEIENPYRTGALWFKGNFHMHSSHSDGALLPGELAEIYRQAGYAVLCITDHNQYGSQDGGVEPRHQRDTSPHDWNGDGEIHPSPEFGSGVEAYVRDWSIPLPPWAADQWFRPADVSIDSIPLLLSGVEATVGGTHVGLIGYPPGDFGGPSLSWDFLPRLHQAGGFSYVAHPGYANQAAGSFASALPLDSLNGLEIINGLELSQGGPGVATLLWDALLSTGYKLWGLANDDAHTWPGASEAYPFTAFNMVLVDQPTPAEFLRALHQGAFYASTGLLFDEIQVASDTLMVSSPGAHRILFIGPRGQILSEVESCRAAYVVLGCEGYVRVEAHGGLVPGANWISAAWTQPFFVRGRDGTSAPSLPLETGS